MSANPPAAPPLAGFTFFRGTMADAEALVALPDEHLYPLLHAAIARAMTRRPEPVPTRATCVWFAVGLDGSRWTVWSEQPGSPSLDEDGSLVTGAPRMVIERDRQEVARIELRRGGPDRPGWRRLQRAAGQECDVIERFVRQVGWLAQQWEPAPELQYRVTLSPAAGSPGAVDRLLGVLRGLAGRVP